MSIETPSVLMNRFSNQASFGESLRGRNNSVSRNTEYDVIKYNNINPAGSLNDSSQY